jgi:hypothetical protein
MEICKAAFGVEAVDRRNRMSSKPGKGTFTPLVCEEYMSTFVEVRSIPQVRWMRFLLMVLILAGTNSGMAQTQQSTSDHPSCGENHSAATEGSGTKSQSSAELAKQASNPYLAVG